MWNDHQAINILTVTVQGMWSFRHILHGFFCAEAGISNFLRYHYLLMCMMTVNVQCSVTSLSKSSAAWKSLHTAQKHAHAYNTKTVCYYHTSLFSFNAKEFWHKNESGWANRHICSIYRQECMHEHSVLLERSNIFDPPKYCLLALKYGTLYEFACHPFSGPIPIFSVNFQF